METLKIFMLASQSLRSQGKEGKKCPEGYEDLTADTTTRTPTS
jgi:hypothetical protein